MMSVILSVLAKLYWQYMWVKIWKFLLVVNTDKVFHFIAMAVSLMYASFSVSGDILQCMALLYNLIYLVKFLLFFMFMLATDIFRWIKIINLLRHSVNPLWRLGQNGKGNKDTCYSLLAWVRLNTGSGLARAGAAACYAVGKMTTWGDDVLLVLQKN